MKHIQTTSPAEKANRDLYKTAAASSVKASPDHIKTLLEILDLAQQKDLLELEISKRKGQLMGYMQNNGTLVDDDGRVLVSWKNGADKKTVDYDSLFTDLNVAPQTLAKYTRISKGARAFKIEDGNL